MEVAALNKRSKLQLVTAEFALKLVPRSSIHPLSLVPLTSGTYCLGGKAMAAVAPEDFAALREQDVWQAARLQGEEADVWLVRIEDLDPVGCLPKPEPEPAWILNLHTTMTSEAALLPRT